MRLRRGERTRAVFSGLAGYSLGTADAGPRGQDLGGRGGRDARWGGNDRLMAEPGRAYCVRAHVGPGGLLTAGWAPQGEAGGAGGGDRMGGAEQVVDGPSALATTHVTCQEAGARDRCALPGVLASLSHKEKGPAAVQCPMLKAIRVPEHILGSEGTPLVLTSAQGRCLLPPPSPTAPDLCPKQ